MDQPATPEPATSKNATFRGACITSYRISAWDELPDKIQYLAYGQETCPSTGRPHVQAWAYSKKAMRLTGWKKIFPGDHIEQMRGTFSQNDAYCSKESNLTTFGLKPMGNGEKRSLEDLSHTVTEAGLQGQRLSEIVTREEFRSTYVQYHSGITNLYRHAVTEKLRKIEKNFAPEVIYIHGNPGTGKTRYVYEQEPDIYRVPAADGYKWKDGYAGEEAVLYDNITVNNIKSPEILLQEIDRYFMQAPVKGGYIGWRPRRIYFTTVYDITDFSENAGFSDPREFTRRVTSVKHFAIKPH